MRRLCFVILLAACSRPDASSHGYRTVTLAADTIEVQPLARPILTLNGFRGPESVQYDSVQDVYFVSNMEGDGSARDGRGYIVRVSAVHPELMEVFAAGGVNGVTLNSPKGMAIAGDTLWVADIDVIRGFNRRTGAPVAQYDLSGQQATLLNALAVGPDGTLYATDSGIIMTRNGVLYPRGDRVFALRHGGVRVIAAGDSLGLPNGIDWDARRQRLVIASFHPFRSEVYALAANGRRTVLATGPGRFDGLVVLPDGRILTTCWKDFSLHLIDGERHQRIATGLIEAADIGLDTRRHRVLVPLVLSGQVVILQL